MQEATTSLAAAEDISFAWVLITMVVLSGLDGSAASKEGAKSDTESCDTCICGRM